MMLAGGLAACALPGATLAPAHDPLTPEEHNDLGVAYHARGEYALAAREFARALEARPGWTRGLVNLGDSRLAMGDVEGAIASYQRARVGHPTDPAILNNLAWALLHDPERWPEAGPLIEAALGQAPEPRGYYLDTLGMLRLRQGAATAALEAFRAALGDSGLVPAARALVRRHAGEALLRLGDPVGAERCFRAGGLGGLAGGPADAPGAGPDGANPDVGRGHTVC